MFILLYYVLFYRESRSRGLTGLTSQWPTEIASILSNIFCCVSSIFLMQAGTQLQPFSGISSYGLPTTLCNNLLNNKRLVGRYHRYEEQMLAVQSRQRNYPRRVAVSTTRHQQAHINRQPPAPISAPMTITAPIITHS